MAFSLFLFVVKQRGNVCFILFFFLLLLPKVPPLIFLFYLAKFDRNVKTVGVVATANYRTVSLGALSSTRSLLFISPTLKRKKNKTLHPYFDFSGNIETKSCTIVKKKEGGDLTFWNARAHRFSIFHCRCHTRAFLFESWRGWTFPFGFLSDAHRREEMGREPQKSRDHRSVLKASIQYRMISDAHTYIYIYAQEKSGEKGKAMRSGSRRHARAFVDASGPCGRLSVDQITRAVQQLRCVYSIGPQQHLFCLRGVCISKLFGKHWEKIPAE